MSVPGPGRPVTMSTAAVPVAASQKVATSVASPCFGYVGSGHAGDGTVVSPVRTIASAPAGKHGVWVLFEQHAWLTPPLMSRHWPSGVVATQAFPVHVAPHVDRKSVV